MKRDSNGSAVLLWAALAVFVVWLALLGGGCCGEGLRLFEWLNAFSAALEAPFSIHITPYTKKFVLIALAFYGFAVAWYYSEKGNRRPGEEHGSAYWGRPKEVCAHFRTKKNDRYLLISKHIRISMNVRALPPQHQVNANILVIGGSGAGKTRFFIKPNLMQAECSYIVCDPKGETYRAVGGLLEKMGYEVTIFNLIDMKQSDCYNPFAYLHTDIDAFRLINTLIQNTTPQKSQTSDPFWDKAETAFLSALILYLFHEAPESERNFGTLMYMVINAEAREEDESYRSPVDLLFDDLERVDEDHIAVKNWKVFKQAGPKTAKSILVSASTRLAAFNTEEMAHLTSRDDLSLGTLGDRKRDFTAAAGCQHALKVLRQCDIGELVHQHAHRNRQSAAVFIVCGMVQFAERLRVHQTHKIVESGILIGNNGENVSINIVIQNMAQLKKLFKDSWENVTGNCDTLLYLGGNEASTHEYISKMLGKATIDTRTRGVTKGRSGSSSTNYQNAGRELLMPDEVRMLDNRKALVFIRGERPVMDDKYPIQKHPNYRLTADGGKPPYQKKFDIPSYEQNDLPHEINIENLEILEETEHEEETHSEPHRSDAQGKTALLRRCADLRAGLRRLYARFRRR